MPNTIGYLITWTTYGSWLQGDKRGYVRDGVIYSGNTALQQFNQRSQKQHAVSLTKEQQQIVHKAIIKESESRGQEIYAISVQSNHIHLVVGYIPEPIHKLVAYYKTAARSALKMQGYEGKLWTRGYDKRFCFDNTSLEQKIRYVRSHIT